MEMKSMDSYAREYQHKNRGKGTVSNVNNYSFKFTELPKNNNEKPKEYVVMKSYFLTL